MSNELIEIISQKDEELTNLELHADFSVPQVRTYNQSFNPGGGEPINLTFAGDIGDPDGQHHQSEYSLPADKN